MMKSVIFPAELQPRRTKIDSATRTDSNPSLPATYPFVFAALRSPLAPLILSPLLLPSRFPYLYFPTPPRNSVSVSPLFTLFLQPLPPRTAVRAFGNRLPSFPGTRRFFVRPSPRHISSLPSGILRPAQPQRCRFSGSPTLDSGLIFLLISFRTTPTLPPVHAPPTAAACFRCPPAT